MVSKSKMKMMIAGAAFLCLTCGQGIVDSNRIYTSTFPLTPGSSWKYYDYWILDYFSNLPNSTGDTDYIEIIAEGPDSLFISEGATAFREFSGLLHGEGFSLIRRWYGIEDNRLLEYGYRVITPGFPEENCYYNPPLLRMDLPLFPGRSWIYMRGWDSGNSDTMEVRKSVIGSEAITEAGKIFYCDIVLNERIASATDSVVYSYREWYSNDGLIKSESEKRILPILNEIGELIDSATVWNVKRLVEINILQ
jgi:hypothetical protein